MLDEPQTQWFTAKIQSQEYASGGVDNASKGWLVVLISTLLLNVVVLVYFVLKPGLVTDFSQPSQLFALAVNSPPTEAIAGSCGGGLEGKEYRIGWSIGYDRDHLYIEPKPGSESPFATVESECKHISAQQTGNWKARTGDGRFSTISTAFSLMKLESKPRAKGSIKTRPISGTEPLRPSFMTQSMSSLQSQHELYDFES
jgi:hypothetical protein